MNAKHLHIMYAGAWTNTLANVNERFAYAGIQSDRFVGCLKKK